MRVLFSRQVREFFDKLEIILYEKGYFSFEDYAHKYADELFYDIKTNLPKRPHKPASQHFDQYGKGLYYASFRVNKQTEWYAFFSKYNENGNTIYLVRHIENNHTAAQYL